MPMTIRYYEQDNPERSPSTPPRPPPPLEPLDADDTIVLSDLVRSGEASRLRRRGAMRLDHSGASISSNSSGRHHRRTSASISSPVLAGYGWRADLAADDADGTWGWDTRGSASAEPSYDSGALSAQDRRPVEGSGSDAVFALYCGGRDPDAEDEEESFEPSSLAWGIGTMKTTGSQRTRTNGCGALVHAHARPNWICGAWTARCAASEDVVPLDAFYFDNSESAKFVRDPCGCVREGMGCAACGNPLGTRFVPCQAASGGLFTASTCHAPTPCAPDVHIYTFFTHAVSSMPDIRFPTPDTPIIPSTIPSIPSEGSTGGPMTFAPPPLRRVPRAAPQSSNSNSFLGTSLSLAWGAALATPALARSYSTASSSEMSSPGTVIRPLRSPADPESDPDNSTFFDRGGGPLLDADGVPLFSAQGSISSELDKVAGESTASSLVAR